ncbi:MAG TPA: hypothetical protein VGN21_05460 [Stellaceae bacterium]
MTPLRIKKAGHRITQTGCFTAILLGLAAIYGAGIADAADGRHTRAEATRHHRTVLPARGDVVERRELIVERRGPQVAAGGTVVLRGRRSPATPNTTPSRSNLNGAGYGTSYNPQAPVLLPGAGWDRELDFSGLDYGGPTPLIIPGR